MGIKLKIGTRGSPLAMWQAEWVRDRLMDMDEVDEVELIKIKTQGDKILDVPLAKVGDKGLFTKEIEEALLRKDIDVAVHSMKDVPTKITDGLKVEVITEREDPGDVLISNGVKFADLPMGAIIGTSSLRRRAQLMRARPDLEIVDIRGNIQTRMKKMETEGMAATILAAAGVKRMNHHDRITETIDKSIMLPAVGQGALGLEVRIDDTVTDELTRRLHHPDTADCILAERAFLRRLEGGCQVPIASYATLDGDTITLRGMVADLDGQRLIREEVQCPRHDGEKEGTALAEQLLEQGADEILSEVYGEDIS